MKPSFFSHGAVKKECRPLLLPLLSFEPRRFDLSWEVTRSWELSGSSCKVTKSSLGHAKIPGNERAHRLAKLASGPSSVVYSYQWIWSPYLLVTALQKKNVIRYHRRYCSLSREGLSRHEKWRSREKWRGCHAKWQSRLMTKVLVRRLGSQARLIPLRDLTMIRYE